MQHVPHIFDFVFANETDIWSDLELARHTDFTVVVYDRFQCRQLEDRDGTVNELPECEPIRIAARSFPETNYVQLLLYCCTHGDSSGYHYEWIRPFDISTAMPDLAANNDNSDVTQAEVFPTFDTRTLSGADLLRREEQLHKVRAESANAKAAQDQLMENQQKQPSDSTFCGAEKFCGGAQSALDDVGMPRIHDTDSGDNFLDVVVEYPEVDILAQINHYPNFR